MTAKQARKKSMYTRRSVQAFWSGVLALLGWSRRSSAPLRRRSARLAARQAPVAPPRQPLTLSAAERAAVECAWRVNAPGSEVLAEGKLNLQITRRDARTLAGNGWLNDEVVNFYLQLLTESSPSRPSLHLFSSLFYARLACTAAGYDYPGVRRWTKKVDIFSRHLLLVPVNHHNSHWCLAAIRPLERRIEYYDSMPGRRTDDAHRVCTVLLQYLQDESRTSPGRVQDESHAKLGKGLSTSGWTVAVMRSGTPVQTDCSACGVFAVATAALLAEGQRPPFRLSQEMVPRLRARIAADCLQKRHTALTNAH